MIIENKFVTHSQARTVNGTGFSWYETNSNNSTHVATIKGDELHQLGWWSVTTQKHINYVENELNLKLIK